MVSWYQNHKKDADMPALDKRPNSVLKSMTRGHLDSSQIVARLARLFQNNLAKNNIGLNAKKIRQSATCKLCIMIKTVLRNSNAILFIFK